MSGNDIRSDKKLIIVAINIIVMIAYTLYVRYGQPGELNILVNAFFIAAHIIVCLILAIFFFRKEFVLSALIVLLVGFSTCWLVFSH
jgi:hypothetical protein